MDLKKAYIIALIVTIVFTIIRLLIASLSGYDFNLFSYAALTILMVHVYALIGCFGGVIEHLFGSIRYNDEYNSLRTNAFYFLAAAAGIILTSVSFGSDQLAHISSVWVFSGFGLTIGAIFFHFVLDIEL